MAAVIQEILREAFRGTTLLCIAHRLATVIDFTKILVMDQGRRAELGPARELLSQPDSHLSRIVDSGPKDSSLP